MASFVRPYNKLIDQEKFSSTEVGLTHQFTDAFVRLTDDGDIELAAVPGLAIIMHPQNRSITFIADSVKFITKEKNGMRWNKLSFNDQSTKFTEPTFIPYESQDVQDVYRGVHNFLED